MSPRGGAGSYHYHACVVCRRRYGDSCATPAHNGKCTSCISGLPSVYATGFDPAECCRDGCRPVVKDEIKTYKLAGPGPWFICRTCSRTHSYQPKKEPTT